ncbi:MAG: epoxide hydrolase [Myxococcota bacterium]|nr:epoxide hydrolase [Myxococcota bacterium]
MSDAVQPFHIDVPDAVLLDLRTRLAHTRWPEPVEDAGWDYGVPPEAVKGLCTYWHDAFDWRKQEEALNRIPQFTTEIDGQRLHFLHVRSAEPDALPLVITHGWPGSVVEFLKILPLLTDPASHGGRREDAFHVVCPSMPGYGFSGPTRERGWDVQRVAEAEMELMRRLGYARYGAQGGDWGAMVTTQLGRLDPEHCVGIHLNMVMGFPQQDLDGLSEKEKGWVQEAQAFQAGETGYQQIQGTKPQTLAYALHDSPAGLAAWILEKFRTWSDCGGDVESVFTKDELLTNITIYWVTGTIGSSVRLYYESMKSGRVGFTQGRVEVPTGCAIFPKEIYKLPRRWAESHYNVQHWTEMPRGGHFAAMEQPELLAEDVRAFFRSVRA